MWRLKHYASVVHRLFTSPNKAPVILLSNKCFRFFRWLGVYVVPVHFYSPIPDVRELEGAESSWSRMSQLAGIDMRASAQE